MGEFFKFSLWVGGGEGNGDGGSGSDDQRRTARPQRMQSSDKSLHGPLFLRCFVSVARHARIALFFSLQA